MPLQEYAAILARRWWIVLLPALVAAVLGYTLARAEIPVYRSSIQLEVTGRIDNGQVLAIERLLKQLAARVSTTAVAQEVDQRLHLELGADAVLARIRTQAIPETLHIQIDVDDSSPERAEQIAQAVAQVAQERQTALMAIVPEQERVNETVFDRPEHARLVAPAFRSIVLAAAILGLMAGTVLAFVFDSTERWRGRAIRRSHLSVVPPAHSAEGEQL
ncbi:MAG: protein tyrosine kinase modulator [Chloroflexota bacterium]|jgi:capsular polysaccharide biosynthesis protein|nr:protein tyrosine kinase modulator [Chloroflexota bacterium]